MKVEEIVAGLEGLKDNLNENAKHSLSALIEVRKLKSVEEDPVDPNAGEDHPGKHPHKRG